MSGGVAPPAERNEIHRVVCAALSPRLDVVNLKPSVESQRAQRKPSRRYTSFRISFDTLAVIVLVFAMSGTVLSAVLRHHPGTHEGKPLLANDPQRTPSYALGGSFGLAPCDTMDSPQDGRTSPDPQPVQHFGV